MSYKIISKFIKEIDFKIPDAKTFFSLGKNLEDNILINVIAIEYLVKFYKLLIYNKSRLYRVCIFHKGERYWIKIY